MKKQRFILLILLIVFVLSVCIFRTTTEEEKTLFIPINRVIYEEKSIYSYTIKDAIEGDNIHIFSRFSEKEIDKKKINFNCLKRLKIALVLYQRIQTYG